MLRQICVSTGEHIEGNSFFRDGASQICPDFSTKRLNLLHYGKTAKNILEIGFNAGHSTLVFLLANPRSKIQCFDLGEHKYAHLCYDYLDKCFPGRLSIVWGDSRQTVSSFKGEEHAHDLIHIDGGHATDVFNEDLDNCRRFANAESVVVVDDISFHPKRAIVGMTSLLVDYLEREQLLQIVPPRFSSFHVIVHYNFEDKN